MRSPGTEPRERRPGRLPAGVDRHPDAPSPELRRGRTDLPAFYEHDDGAVLSSAIDKYVYVTVKRHGGIFDEAVRINYSRSEKVEPIAEIENDIARECLRFLQVDPPIYVSTVGDMPASSGPGRIERVRRRPAQRPARVHGERVTAGQLAEEASPHRDRGPRPADRQAGPVRRRVRRSQPVPLQPGHGDGRAPAHPKRVLGVLFESFLLSGPGISGTQGRSLPNSNGEWTKKHESLCRMREQALRLPPAVDQHAGVERRKDAGRGLAAEARPGQHDQQSADRRLVRPSQGGRCHRRQALRRRWWWLPLPRRATTPQPAVRASLEGLREVRVRPETHGSQIVLPYLHW